MSFIGLMQLAKLEQFNKRRREIAEPYTRAFAELSWLACPAEQEGTKSCWHNYVIRTEFRDALNLFLKEKNIATGVHYLPLHLQPYYRSQGQSLLPNCEAIWTRFLSLPIYPDLAEDELNCVIESILEFGRRPNEIRAARSSKATSSTAP